MCSATMVMSEQHAQYVLLFLVLVILFNQFESLTGENSYIGMVTIRGTFFSYIGSTPITMHQVGLATSDLPHTPS